MLGKSGRYVFLSERRDSLLNDDGFSQRHHSGLESLMFSILKAPSPTRPRPKESVNP